MSARFRRPRRSLDSASINRSRSWAVNPSACFCLRPWRRCIRRSVSRCISSAGDRLSTLSAHFDQTHHDYILDEEESSTGTLCFKVPGQIRWEYDSPYPKVLLVKDDKIRLFNPVANQVQEFKKGQMKGAGADLLIGFGKSNAEIGKNYDVSLKEEKPDTVTLALIPKPGSSASIFKAIELTMEKERWIPLRSVFHEPNRNTTEIIFKDIEMNLLIPI